tara:strand:- start:288 stop:977 length:690 start_codon:yes stop_codon:yes gene_type:complete
MVKYLEIKKELLKFAQKERVYDISRFFKTGPGQYGAGDSFLGLYVPDIRKVAQNYKDITFQDIKILLDSKIHEERFLALLILIIQFPKKKRKVYNFYLKNIKAVNNWDLVDLSADKIVGNYLFKKDKKILYNFTQSNNIWQRRIAIIATFYFIKNKQYKYTLKIAKLLLKDEEDLIQKAIGWMLREVGKRELKLLEEFLEKNYENMSRVTLRYAIERFEEKKRSYYLNK